MASGHLEQLERLVAREPTASSLDAKLVLARLTQEIQERRVSAAITSTDFFVGVMRAMTRIRGTSHHSVRMECIWECGKFFELHDLHGPALEIADQLEVLARRSNDTAWLRKSYTFAGIMYARFGSVAEAIIRHAKSLDLVANECRENQVSVLSNISMTLINGGLYAEAIQCSQRALELAQLDNVAYESALVSLNNLAVANLYLEQFPAGLAAIRECLAMTGEPQDARSALSRTIREWTFVQLALELDLLEEARQHATACERYGQWGANHRTKGFAVMARGLCDVYGGDVDEGLQALESLLAESREAFSSREEMLRALIKAYELAGRADRALEYVEVLMKEIQIRRSETLQAVLRWRMAVSAPEDIDAKPLEFREAKLRAQVAETALANSRLEMFERLAITADLKEEPSGEHGYRVGKVASLLAFELAWRREDAQALELAARLHDIGKIGLPDRILLTTQELRAAERNLISSHTLIGAELLAKSDIPQLRMAEDIARYHHEWWNGTGYPAKLAGKRIPIHARIVALADVFDALTHGRPYAPAWPIEKALEEIQVRRGTQFDPELTDKFIELVHRLQSEHTDLDEFLGRAGRNSPFAQARNRIRLMLEEGRERIEKQTSPAPHILQ